MLPIVTPEQMRSAEAQAEQAGTSESEMMARAGKRIADWVDANVLTWGPGGQMAAALVGPGNNGGDALVALAELAGRGWDCAALLIGRDRVGDVPADPDLIEKITIADDVAILHSAHVILDGIYGSGGRADLDARVDELIETALRERKHRRVPLVAIDAPSGVDSATGEAAEGAFRADVTLCVQFPKFGLLYEPAASLTGDIVALDIGIPEPDGFSGPRMITAQSALEHLPARTAYAHKSQVGGLLVVSGSPAYLGAPRMTAEAALRAGPGYVGLATPRSVILSIAGEIPEVIYHPTPETDGRQSATAVIEALGDEQSRYTAIAIGPGIGRDRPAEDLMHELLAEPEHEEEENDEPEIQFGIPRRASARTGNDEAARIVERYPVVLDADALYWLASQENWPALLQGVEAVLTPHAGEMARLLDTDIDEIVKDPFAAAQKAAQEWGQVVVLKVGYTAVARPDGAVWVAPRAPAELATAGTGDVLTGIIGGLLAQGLNPADAAACAVYLGSRAGQLARDEFGTLSVAARDVIANLPLAIAELQEPQWQR